MNSKNCGFCEPCATGNYAACKTATPTPGAGEFPLTDEQAIRALSNALRGYTIFEPVQLVVQTGTWDPVEGLTDKGRAVVNAIAEATVALRAQPAEGGKEKATTKFYVECRECSNCGHVGINDDAAGMAACNHCDWNGPSPKEDHCPQCEQDGTMTGSCSECGHRTTLIAETYLATPKAAEGEQSAALQSVKPKEST